MHPEIIVFSTQGVLIEEFPVCMPTQACLQDGKHVWPVGIDQIVITIMSHCPNKGYMMESLCLGALWLLHTMYGKGRMHTFSEMNNLSIILLSSCNCTKTALCTVFYVLDDPYQI